MKNIFIIKYDSVKNIKFHQNMHRFKEFHYLLHILSICQHCKTVVFAKKVCLSLVFLNDTSRKNKIPGYEQSKTLLSSTSA